MFSKARTSTCSRCPRPIGTKATAGDIFGSLDTRRSAAIWTTVGSISVVTASWCTTATRLALYISPGHHGNIHRQKYFDKGQPFPVAISFGPDPLLVVFRPDGNPGRASRSTIMPAACVAKRYEVIHRQAHRTADSGLFGDRHRRRSDSRHENSRGAVRRIHRLLCRRAALRADAQSEAAHVSQRSDHHRRAAVQAGAGGGK